MLTLKIGERMASVVGGRAASLYRAPREVCVERKSPKEVREGTVPWEQAPPPTPGHQNGLVERARRIAGDKVREKESSSSFSLDVKWSCLEDLHRVTQSKSYFNDC